MVRSIMLAVMRIYGRYIHAVRRGFANPRYVANEGMADSPLAVLIIALLTKNDAMVYPTSEIIPTTAARGWDFMNALRSQVSAMRTTVRARARSGKKVENVLLDESRVSTAGPGCTEAVRFALNDCITPMT